MKAERLAKLLDEVVWDESLFLRVRPEVIELLIRYILNADIDKAAFDRRVLEILSTEIRSTAMTIAQQYRQEGRQEGRLGSLQENVIAALEIRFGEIPQGMREAIAGITAEPSLRALLRAAIQSSSLEDFSNSL